MSFIVKELIIGSIIGSILGGLIVWGIMGIKKEKDELKKALQELATSLKEDRKNEQRK